MKKVLSMFMAVIMLMSSILCVNFSASADEITSGDFKYEILDDGTIAITGYTGEATNLTIPSQIDNYTVKTIDYFALYDCNTLINVIISDGIKYIAPEAFSQCKSIENITIPDSVTLIGDEAFYGCSNLKNVNIGSGLEKIGSDVYNCYYVFRLCDNLEQINIDEENLKFSSIDGVLFNKDKTDLIQYPIGNKRENYTIPDGVVNILYSSFRGSKYLKNVVIPDSVTTIKNEAFRGCENLCEVSIGNSITEIPEYAFEDCYNLLSVFIPESVTKIGSCAFGTYMIDMERDGGIEGFTIYGKTGSEAQRYADKMGFIFIDNSKPSEPCVHIWDNGVVTLNPTCKENGIKTFTCSICGEICTEEISAIGHDFGNNNSTCVNCGIANPNYVAPVPPVTQVPTQPNESDKQATIKKSAVKKPKKAAIKKLNKAKKSFKVYWKKLSGVKGYQVQYSTSKKFTKKTTKTVTIKSSKTTGITVKKLKDKKKYYVRVRGFNKAKINGKTKTVYGSWSKTKSVTTKK